MMIAIVAAKLAARILRRFGRGASTLPGRIALKLQPSLLRRVSRGVKVICVTGTNGKTTTCALIAHMLEAARVPCILNGSGANMLTGVATAFLTNCTLGGRCKKAYAVLECDENSLPLITRYLDADLIAVTNIFRDQLDRYGELTHTLARIADGIRRCPQATVLLNADCPLTCSLAGSLSNRTVTFGIQGNFDTAAVSDVKYCPRCEAPLLYTSRTYAQLGSYRCPRCGYCRPEPEYELREIRALQEGGYAFLFGGEQHMTALGGLYNLYNCCCAAAVLRLLGFGNTTSLSAFTGAFGRMETFRNGDRTVLLLLVKNPVGLSGCIRYVCGIRGALDIAFALNDNDADGRDVSWIWDSDFTPIREKTDCVYTLGRRAYDMALRLKYDGIAATVLEEDAQRLTQIIRDAPHDFIIFASYTAMMRLRHTLIEAFGGKEFWESSSRTYIPRSSDSTETEATSSASSGVPKRGASRSR